MMKCIEGMERIARKNHKCDYCGLLIPKGVEYVNQIWVGKDEGWWSERMHLQCEKAALDNLEWEKRYELLQSMDELTFQNKVLSPEALKEIKALLPSGIKDAKRQLAKTKKQLANRLFDMRFLETMSDEYLVEKEISDIMDLLDVFLATSKRHDKIAS